MRRAEYSEKDPAVLDDILDRVQWGTLALLGDDGWPMVRPMNFARLGNRVYFHGAKRGEKAERLDGRASFVAAEPLAWVPSSWRHPQMACPATTYYRSVMARGELCIVTDPAEKAAALQRMMEKYQPEGGYARIDAGDPRYRGPLEALEVTSLELTGATCKVKVGQNLEPSARQTVFERLLQRRRPGDIEAARAMAAVDPTLSSVEALLPVREEDGLVFVDRAGQIPAEQVKALLDTTYWAAQRPLEKVRRLLHGSQVVVAALDGDRLAGFARAVTDGSVHAWIFDVVVAPDQRGRGVGTRVMRRLLAHPVLRDVTTVRLDTRDAMPFYERLGFETIGTKKSGNYTASTMVRRAAQTGVGDRV